MFITQHRRPFCLFLLLVLFSGSFLVSILPDFFFHGLPLVNEQLHSSIEAFGALAAISISLLFLNFHQDGQREKGEYFLLSMGFLMMMLFVAIILKPLIHTIRVLSMQVIVKHKYRALLIWSRKIWIPPLSCKRFRPIDGI